MRFNRRGGERRKPELNLASMIDATFLLLAFFIFTTGQGQNESKLSPNLRVEKGTEMKDDLEPQVLEVLRLDGTPAFRLGSTDFTARADLQAALEALPKEKGLFVRVYGGVDVGFAAAAIQCARDAGFEAVTYVPAK
jgi:biopolymer transport protein ExbD